MNSLLSYGSDDDYDDSSEEKQPDWRAGPSKDKQGSSGRQVDANYEEVQMDLSEESNESKPETKEQPAANRRSRDRKEKEERDRDDHYRRRDDRDRERSRKDRDRDRKHRRSSSRERRRSRSPRRSRRSRSRSRSRDRKYGSRRYDKTNNKMAQLDKMGIEIKTPDCQYVKPSDLQKSMDQERDKQNTNDNSDRFFMPGITGRFRDQIERRKQLWQKKEADVDKPNGQSKKVWETTTFAQDTDGKVANKFKRLMGIRGKADSSGSPTDVLKKQEEMFSSMEQQYEVARTATHTMRGVGLGFGSFQR